MREVRVSYSENWIRVHIGALEAAYNSTAFFPMIKEELTSALLSRPEFIYELNQLMNAPLFRAAGISLLNQRPDVNEQLEFFSHADIFKLPAAAPYPQPFMHRHGFNPGLSGIDLVSCMGRL
jgi:WbqC-like protein family